jgi:RNA polymerase sigma factor (TIGR02999 family)
LPSSRSHFFAIASKVMRRILLDHAKARLRDKRGGGAMHVEFADTEDISVEKSMQLVALDEAMEQLAKIDPIKSLVVEMRHFGGMSVEETAEKLFENSK